MKDFSDSRVWSCKEVIQSHFMKDLHLTQKFVYDSLDKRELLEEEETQPVA